MTNTQEQLQTDFLNVFYRNRDQKTKCYHDIEENTEEQSVRDEFVATLTNIAQHLTVTSRIAVFHIVSEYMPEYRAYWLLGSLGGNETSAAQKIEIFKLLAQEYCTQTRQQLLDYFDERDLLLLAKVTALETSERDSEEPHIG